MAGDPGAGVADKEGPPMAVALLPPLLLLLLLVALPGTTHRFVTESKTILFSSPKLAL